MPQYLINIWCVLINEISIHVFIFSLVRWFMNKGQMKSCILLKWLGWTDEHEFLFLKTSHDNTDNNNSILFNVSILLILWTEEDVLPESVIPTVRSLFSTSATVWAWLDWCEDLELVYVSSDEQVFTASSLTCHTKKMW